MNFFKLLSVTLAIIIHSTEHYGWLLHRDRYDLRCAFFGINTVCLFVILLYHFVQPPFTRALDNRLRGATIGVIFGFSLMSFVEQCVYLSQTEKTGFNGNLFYAMAISAAVFGCLAFVVSNRRLESLNVNLQLDINEITKLEEREVEEYANYLRTFILMEEEPGLFLTHMSKKNYSEATESKQKFDSTNQQVSHDQGSSSNIMKKTSNLLYPALNVQRMNSTSNSEPLGSVSSLNIGAPKSAALNPEQQAIQDVLAQHKHKERLALYLQSQNFASLHKSLNFNSDIELTLRKLCIDWDKLSDSQRIYSRVAVMQLYAALYIRSVGGLDGSCPACYFLWFAAACITMWTDFPLCTHSIQIAYESDASMPLDMSYLAFLIQKSCEELRTANLQSQKRATGVTDLAAFRRWTMNANLSHEKAISALKKFFKSSLSSIQFPLEEMDIFSSETPNDAKKRFISNSSSELTPQNRKSINANVHDHFRDSSSQSSRVVMADSKMISEMTKTLHVALNCLQDADEAYTSLLSRYPTVSIVHSMVCAFRRQIFRDETPIDVMLMNLNGPGHSAVAAVNRRKTSSNTSSTKEGNMEGLSGEGENDAGHDNHSEDSSALGLLSETPKYLRLNHAADAVKRTFNVVRYVSFGCLVIVLGVVIFFLMMTNVELNRVDKWLNTYSVTADTFDRLPDICVQVNRVTTGLGFMAREFFTPVKNQMSPFVDSVVTRSSTSGVSAAGDKVDCKALMSMFPQSYKCFVAYADGNMSVALQGDLATGMLSDAASTLSNVYLTAQFDSNDEHYWWAVSRKVVDEKIITATTPAQESFIQGFSTSQNRLTAVDRFIGRPLFYIPLGAPPGTVPQFQGVVMLFSPANRNDQWTQFYLNEYPTLGAEMSRSVNEFINVSMTNNITPLINVLQLPTYKITHYSTDGTATPQMKLATELSAIMTSYLSLIYEKVKYNFDFEQYISMPETKTVIEFCNSPAASASNTLLIYFSAYLTDQVSYSVMIVTVCACSALLACVIAAAFSIRLVRISLKEFDRTDGVQPFLSIFAVLPRPEIRRLCRNIQHLRVDRGLIDPDDEKSGYYDPKMKRTLVRVTTHPMEDDGAPQGEIPLTAANQSFVRFAPQDRKGETDNSADGEKRVIFSSVLAPLPTAEPSLLPRDGGKRSRRDSTSSSGALSGKGVCDGVQETTAVEEDTYDHPQGKDACLQKFFNIVKKSVKMSLRIISLNGLIFRPISRSVLILWSLMMIFVIVCLFLSSNTVRNYDQIYADISAIIGIGYSMSVVALNSAPIAMGVANDPTSQIAALQFRGTDWEDFLQFFSTQLELSRSDFFNLIDREDSSGQSVGRRRVDRDTILYEPGCYSDSVANVAARITCDISQRDPVLQYSGSVRTHFGLVRAMTTATTTALELQLKQTGVGKFVSASDREIWWFTDALRVDISPALEALLATFQSEALQMVKDDKKIQNTMLIVGICLSLVLGFGVEIVVKYEMNKFKNTLMLLKLLPSRYLNDYRVLEYALNVHSDDDEATLLATTS
eukprot:GDKJ01004616.1.p1 GENE.GDKJ01004616.1~~GDKJ01004616.1.p1  ORF type:complete len:1765 (-),score=278.96 GDKJ01004616.1:140-4723(-)